MQATHGVVVQTEIKQFIVTLMLQSEEGLRRQLSAALALIAKSDFPSNWNTLLPELAQKLGGGNLDVQVRGGTAHPCQCRQAPQLLE